MVKLRSDYFGAQLAGLDILIGYCQLLKMSSLKLYSQKFLFVILFLLCTLTIIKYFGQEIEASETFGNTLILNSKTNNLNSDNQEIRLFGVQIAPYSAECMANGVKWNCGHEAHRAIALTLREIYPYCIRVTETTSSSERIVFYECFVQDRSLNAKLVQSGWALSATVENAPYQLEELHAQRNKDGMFRGGFLPPNEWRPEYMPIPTNCGVCGERHKSKLRTHKKLKKNR